MQKGLTPVWQPAYDLIEPRISADGVHTYEFDSALPVDVRYLTFDRDADIRSNRHEYFELLYAYSGGVAYQVQDRLCELGEGDLFVMGSTLMHRIVRFSQVGFRAVVLYFDPALLRAICSGGRDRDYLMPFLIQDKDFPHVISMETGTPREVLGLMEKIASACTAQSFSRELTVETYLKTILVHLIRHYEGFQASEPVFLTQKHNLRRVRPVFQHVDEYYREPISVEEAAALIKMSKSTFTRFFKQVTGDSFVVYLNRFRIARAQTLLKNTDKSIAEVSQETGFCDQSYFGAMFKRMVGRTPREYKRACSDRVGGLITGSRFEPSQIDPRIRN